MKYFYTDPLAAAWMAKHHGMRFQITYPGGAMRDVSKQELLATKALDWMAREFYIHPDSLNLLEPQPHDIVETEREGLGGKFIAYEYHQLSLDVLGYRLPVKRIIQRNGIAFMWPEQEL